MEQGLKEKRLGSKSRAKTLTSLAISHLRRGSDFRFFRSWYEGTLEETVEAFHCEV